MLPITWSTHVILWIRFLTWEIKLPEGKQPGIPVVIEDEEQ